MAEGSERDSLITLGNVLALAEGNEKSHKKFICCVYCLKQRFNSEYNEMGGKQKKDRKRKHILMNLKTVMVVLVVTPCMLSSHSIIIPTTAHI